MGVVSYVKSKLSNDKIVSIPSTRDVVTASNYEGSGVENNRLPYGSGGATGGGGASNPTITQGIDNPTLRQNEQNLRDQIAQQQKQAEQQKQLQLDAQTKRQVLEQQKQLELQKRYAEVYSQQAKGFVRVSPTGERGTAYIRPPTPQERIELQKPFEKSDKIVKLITGETFERKLIERKGKGKSYEEFKALEEARKEGMKEEIGKVSPVFKLSRGASEGIIRTSEFITRQKIEPTARARTKETISDLLLVSGFSPAIARGTASKQESQYVYDSVRGRFVKKEELQSYAEKIIADFDKAYLRKGQKGVAEELVRVIKQAKGETKGIENLLEQLKQKNYISGYAVDTNTGQFSVQGFSQPTATQTKGIEFSVRLPGKVKVPQVNILQQRETQQQFETLSTKTNGKQEQNIFIKPQIQTKQRQRTGVLFNPKQETILKTKEKTKQDEVTKQTTRLLSSLKSAQQQRLQSETMQKQVQESVSRTRQRQRQRRIPRLFWLPTNVEERKTAILSNKKTNLFDIFVRRQGQFRKVGSYESLFGAKLGLRRVLEKTLGASGYVKDPLGKVKPIDLGVGFRPSKKNKGVVVQKRGKRLSSRSEVKEILSAKRKKSRSKFSSSWI